MKILLLTHYFPPVRSIATHRPYSWARTWAEAGHEVHVVTPSKYSFDAPFELDLPCDGFTVHTVPYLGRAPVGDVSAPIDDTRQSTVNPGSLPLWYRIKRFTRPLRQYLGWLADIRTLSTPSLVKKCLTLTAEKQFDIIVSTFGPASATIAASIVARRTGIRWVADYRDLWTGSYIERSSWLTDITGGWFERRIIAPAELLVTVSDGLAERLRARHSKPCVVSMFGYLEYDTFFPLKEMSWSDDKLHFVYTGRVYPANQGMEALFAGIAKALAARPDLARIVAVDFFGPEQDFLAHLQRRYSTSEIVRLHGECSHGDARARQDKADALMFFDWLDPHSPGVLTGKLFEYLHAGKRILVVRPSSASEAVALIERVGSGTLLPDVQAVEQFFTGLPHSWTAPAVNAAAVNDISATQQASDLLGAISRLANNA